ncbi:UNVERIFIED_ORG: hypothetical protein FHU01_4351 [Citrobacter freundii]
MSGQLVEKLKTFNWKDDKPRMWPSCKFGMQITACCMALSLLIILPAVFIDFEAYFIFFIYASIAHFFSAIITIGELGEISSIQRVLMKIEPDSDILSKSERLKVRCMLYAFRMSLVIIAVAVGGDLQFALFSGAVFALSGAIFTCIFSCKVRKLFPGDFVRIVSFYMWGGRRSKDNTSCSSNNWVNPASGLPMLNNTIDVGGNAWGSDDHRWDDRW